MNLRLFGHRGIAPIVANLVLIAMAVVGATIAFVFAQVLINDSQVSADLSVELVKFHGYDARDIGNLIGHNGVLLSDDVSGGYTPDQILGPEERIAFYFENLSTKPIVIKEFSFGGEVYPYSVPVFNDFWDSYAILSNTYPSEQWLDSTSPEIKPGKTVTVLLGIEHNIKLHRTVMFKLTTESGFVVPGRIITGEQKG